MLTNDWLSVLSFIANILLSALQFNRDGELRSGNWGNSSGWLQYTAQCLAQKWWSCLLNKQVSVATRCWIGAQPPTCRVFSSWWMDFSGVAFLLQNLPLLFSVPCKEGPWEFCWILPWSLVYIKASYLDMNHSCRMSDISLSRWYRF